MPTKKKTTPKVKTAKKSDANTDRVPKVFQRAMTSSLRKINGDPAIKASGFRLSRKSLYEKLLMPLHSVTEATIQHHRRLAELEKEKPAPVAETGKTNA